MIEALIESMDPEEDPDTGYGPPDDVGLSLDREGELESALGTVSTVLEARKKEIEEMHKSFDPEIGEVKDPDDDDYEDPGDFFGFGDEQPTS